MNGGELDELEDGDGLGDGDGVDELEDVVGSGDGDGLDELADVVGVGDVEVTGDVTANSSAEMPVSLPAAG